MTATALLILYSTKKKRRETMIKSMKPVSVLALAAGMFVFTSCSDDDDSTPTPTGPTQTIAQIVAGNANYSILNEALEATGLDATLQGSGSFTVFGPNNDAFNALFDELLITDANSDGSRVDDLAAAIGVDAVTDILLYHVLGAEILAANVPVKAYVSTLSDAAPDDRALSLLVEKRTSGVVLNNGPVVVAADIRATNGVIHGIDEVLLLPNIVDHASNNADFSELVDALVATDLVPALLLPGPFTVFAPVNQAFEDISAVTATLTLAQLTTVLTYHVVAGNVQSTQLVAGPVTSINDQQFTVNVGTSVTITDTTEGVSNVIATDVQGTNGVIHVLDRVLLPVY
jgi:transforming growth factor-beta-induced protein